MIRHLCKLVWNRKRANALTAFQIFISFLIVFITASLAVDKANIYRQPLGFSYENRWVVEFREDRTRPAPSEAEAPSRRHIYQALEEFDWVESVAVANSGAIPYSNTRYGAFSKEEKMVGLGNVSDEFHEVFDLNLVSGRWFSEEDAALDWEPLVITQPLSEALFGREDPIGQQVEEWGGDDGDGRVVGVVSAYRRRGEFSEDNFFILARLEGDDHHTRFLVKVRPDTPLAAQEQIFKRLKAMAPWYIVDITTLEEDRSLVVQVDPDVSVRRRGRLGVGAGHGGAVVERRAVAADDAENRGDRSEKGLGRVGGQYLRAVDGRDAGGRQHRRNRWPAARLATPTAGTARLHQRDLRAQYSPCSAGDLRPRDRVQPVPGTASLPDTAGRGAAPRMSRNVAVRKKDRTNPNVLHTSHRRIP